MLAYQVRPEPILTNYDRQDQFIALKVFIRSQALGDHIKNEMSIYERIEQCKSRHAGRSATRTLLDSFQVSGPDGEHLVLAHPPLGDSLETGIRRSPVPRLPPSGLRYILKDIFLALHYLHVECRIIHTGKKRCILLLWSPTINH